MCIYLYTYVFYLASYTHSPRLPFELEFIDLLCHYKSLESMHIGLGLIGTLFSFVIYVKSHLWSVGSLSVFFFFCKGVGVVST